MLENKELRLSFFGRDNFEIIYCYLFCPLCHRRSRQGLQNPSQGTLALHHYLLSLAHFAKRIDAFLNCSNELPQFTPLQFIAEVPNDFLARIVRVSEGHVRNTWRRFGALDQHFAIQQKIRERIHKDARLIGRINIRFFVRVMQGGQA